MKRPDNLKIVKVFSSGGDVQYVLPHFQREYTWGKEQWQVLLDDIFAIYDEYTDKNPPEHFMGSLVVINDNDTSNVFSVFKLVDGQQRLTTISLMLCALERLIKSETPALKRKLRKLLVNEDEQGDLHYKILPTTKFGDREAYIKIIDGEVPDKSDSKIPASFLFLEATLKKKIEANEIQPERLFVILTTCLEVVFIDLNHDESPYKIFESLNAKGKPLTQADLVRNYIAMKLPLAEQQGVFNSHWSKIEEFLQEKRNTGRSGLGELTAFLRHYLAMQSGILINEGHVYARFRDRMEKEFPNDEDFITELSNVRRYAEHYDKFLRPEHEPNVEIRQVLNRLNILETATACPFLLRVYDAYHKAELTVTQMKEVLSVLENYLLRRWIASEPTNYLNKMFPQIWGQVELTATAETLRNVLASRNYPSDRRVRQAISTNKLYDSRSRDKIKLILEGINRHLSLGTGAFTALDSSATIEHIMPQNLNHSWQSELGQDWNQSHKDNLHLLGNLTLVTQEWNSGVLSNYDFVTKRKRLSEHGLLLNKVYFTESIAGWDEAAIRVRAEFLADKFMEIWPAIGEPEEEILSSSSKPRVLTIQGNSFSVKTWRDVTVKTVQFVIANCKDFDAIAREIPQLLSRDSFLSNWPLSNGWNINVRLSSERVSDYCQKLLETAGYSRDDWAVTEYDVLKQGTVTNAITQLALIE